MKIKPKLIIILEINFDNLTPHLILLILQHGPQEEQYNPITEHGHTNNNLLKIELFKKHAS